MLLTPWLRSLPERLRLAHHCLASRAGPRRRPIGPGTVERLEPRLVLSAAGNPLLEPLVITAGSLADDGQADVFAVGNDGEDVTISVNGVEVYRGRPSDLVLQGSSDEDVVTIDLTAGSTLSSLRLDFADQSADAIHIDSISLETGRFEVAGDVLDALTFSGSVLAGQGVSAEAGLISVGATATITSSEGLVHLDAGAGRLEVRGRIDVSGEHGGEVRLLGDEVGLWGHAALDASGDLGGGTILVGGDFQGANPDVRNATRTGIGTNVTLTADAREMGNGGRIIVWADGYTQYGGSISARGGAGGDGGFAEVSGKQTLAFAGRVNLGADHGRGGSLLLDPKNATIEDTVSPDDLTTNDEFAENPGADVSFDADTITAVTNTGTAIVIQANNDIIVNEAIVTDNSTGDGGNITFVAGRSVLINASITTDSGDLVIIANAPLALGVQNAHRDAGDAVITGTASIDAGSGNVDFSLSDGSGLTNQDSGAITLGDITTTGLISIESVGAAGATGKDIILAGTLTGLAVTVRTDAGAIVDAATNDNFVTVDLMLIAATGITGAGTVTQIAAETQSGGISYRNTGDLFIGDLGLIGGLHVANSGPVGILVEATGSITVNAVISGPVGIAIQTFGADTDVTVNETVQVLAGQFAGSLGVVAVRDVLINADLVSAGGSMLVDAGRDILQSGGAESAVGSLSANLTYDADRMISLTTGAAISTVNGGISLTANSGSAAGTFTGLTLNQATIATSAGSISLHGNSGSAGNDLYGVSIEGGSVVQSTSAAGGQIFIAGVSHGDGSQSIGVNIEGVGTALTSAGANIHIEGTGGGTSGGSGTDLNVGVFLSDGAEVIATGTAGITIEGHGGAARTENFGVRLEGAQTLLSVEDGFLQLDGQGGAGSGIQNIGIISQFAVVQATGEGAILITGTGGTGALSAGVELDFGARVDAMEGSISIEGTGGAGSSTTDFMAGVTFFGGGLVRSLGTTATASVTINGTGTTGEDENYGVLFQGAGSGVTSLVADVSITGIAGSGDALNVGVRMLQGAEVITNSADIFLFGQGGSGTDENKGLLLQGADTNVTSLSGNVSLSGLGGNSIGNLNTGVHVLGDGTSGPLIQTAGAGTISLSGSGGAGVDANAGVVLENVATVLAENGTISIDGGGSGTATGVENYGVALFSGAVVATTGIDVSASVSIDGTSGGGTDGNWGIAISNAGTSVTTVGGNLSLSGSVNASVTGNLNLGLGIAEGAVVATTGSNDSTSLSITGFAGAGDSQNAGVEIDGTGTSVFAQSGGINITGFGGGGLSPTSFNAGIRVSSGAVVEAQGITPSGSIFLNGLGGPGTDFNSGVEIDNASVLAAAGSLSLHGIASGSTTGRFNSGVVIDQSVVATTGSDVSAAISINGTGGGGSFGNTGVIITDQTFVRTVAGHLSIHGAAQSNTSEDGNTGVEILHGSQVLTIGTEATTFLNISGTGGGGTVNNRGVEINSSNTRVAAQSGSISIQGTGGTTTDDEGFGWGITVRNGAVVEALGTDTSASVTLSGQGGEGVSFNDGISTFGTGTRISSVNGDINLSGSAHSDSTGGFNNGVILLFGTQIEATGTGNVSIFGSGGGGTEFNYGVYIQDSTTRVSVDTGSLTIQGIGSLATTGDFNIGVGLYNEAVIRSTGVGPTVGAVSIFGHSGTSGGTAVEHKAYGVDMDGGFFGAGLRLSVVDASLSIHGTSQNTVGSDNIGVHVANRVTIQSTGSNAAAVVSITGNGGDGDSRNQGVQLSGSLVQVSSQAADIHIFGNGGGGLDDNQSVLIDAAAVTSVDGDLVFQGISRSDTTGDRNVGVAFVSGGTATIAGTGALDIFGIGGGGVNDNQGVSVEGAASLLSANAGNLTIQGFGQFGTTGDSNVGVALSNGVTILAGGTGNVSINGQSGDNGANFNHGVSLFDNVSVTVVDGDLQIVGAALSSTGQTNIGVTLEFAVEVLATGIGSVSLSGVGGSGTSFNDGIRVSGSRVASVNGDVHLNGGARAGTSDNDNIGVEIEGSSVIESIGTGTVTVTGTSGTGIDFNSGISVTESRISTVDGDLFLTGSGRNGSIGDGNIGVALETGADVLATGTGSIFVSGFGGSGESFNIGTSLDDGATIESAQGDISISGQALGGAGGTFNTGVAIAGTAGLGALVQSTSGSISLSGQGGDGTSSNHGVHLSGNVLVLVANADLSVSGGASSGTTGDGNTGVTVEGASARLRATGTGSVSLFGLGGGGGSFNDGIHVIGGSSLNSTDGAMLLDGQAQSTTTGSDNRGVVITNSSVTANGVQNLDITGTGGSGTSGNIGVAITATSGAQQITSAGGNISITGTGGNGTTNLHGVNLSTTTGTLNVGTTGAGDVIITGNAGAGVSSNRGVNLVSVTLTVVDGDLSVLGTGHAGSTGQFNVGIATFFSQFTATGAGSLSLTGQGGGGTTDNIGVSLSDSEFTTASGDIAITGTGGAATANSNTGTSITNSQISAGGTGSIDLTGVGGTGTSTNHGLLLSNAQVVSADGNIAVDGRASAATTGSNNNGVIMTAASTVRSTGAGQVTIIGIGGNGTSFNNGILMTGLGTRVSSVNGNVEVRGEARSTTTGRENIGVEIEFLSRVDSTGTGSVVVSGVGGGGTDMNPGLFLNDADVSSNDGNLFLAGTAGDGSGELHQGISLLNSDVRTTGTGDILIDGFGEIGTSNNQGFTMLGSSVEAEGTGDVSVHGRGGTGTFNQIGVEVREGSVIIANGGDLFIDGIGGNGSQDGNHGVSIFGGAVVQSNSASGVLRIDGTANATGTDTNVGIFISGDDGSGNVSTVRTAGADLILLGVAEAGSTGTGNRGVRISEGAAVESTGGGAIDITGFGGSGVRLNSGIFVSDGRVSTVDGNLTLTGFGGSGTGNSQIGVDLINAEVSVSGTGTLLIEGFGGTGDSNLIGVSIVGSDVFTAGTDLTVTGEGGNGTGSENYGVLIADGSDVWSIDIGGGGLGVLGTLSIDGTGGNGVDFNVGVRITGPGSGSGTPVSSNALDIVIIGQGGVLATGTGNVGVQVDDGGILTATGLASISVTGTGGAGTTRNHGIGVFTDGAITTEDGNLILFGTAGGTDSVNAGVTLVDGAEVAVTGIGSVDIRGTGGLGTDFEIGVDIFGSGTTVSTAGGAIFIFGAGGTAATGNSNYGLRVFQAQVTSTATGSIELVGHGGTGTSDNVGLEISGAGTLVSVEDGLLELVGAGGSSVSENHGIRLNDSALVRSTGTGEISLIGSAGSGIGSHALEILNLAQILAAGTGSVTLDAASILFATGGNISAAGNAVVIVTLATGQPGTLQDVVSAIVAESLTISFQNPLTLTAAVTTTSDIEQLFVFAEAIFLNAAVSFGGSLLQLEVDNLLAINASLTTATADVVLIAENLDIAAPVDVGTNSITIHPPFNAGLNGEVEIELGSDDTAGVLGLTAAELAFITAGTLAVTNSGHPGVTPLAITVTQELTLSSVVELLLASALVAINADIITPNDLAIEQGIGTGLTLTLDQPTRLHQVDGNLRIGNSTAGAVEIASPVHFHTSVSIVGGRDVTTGTLLTDNGVRIDVFVGLQGTGSNSQIGRVEAAVGQLTGGELNIHGGFGNDTITASPSVLPTEVFGGFGFDTLVVDTSGLQSATVIQGDNPGDGTVVAEAVGGEARTLQFNSIEQVDVSGVATTRTWDGDGGANSDIAAAINWVGDVAPVAGDFLVFPPTAGQLVLTNTFASGTEFQGIRLEDGYTLTGNGITLGSGGIEVVSSGARPSVLTFLVLDVQLDATRLFTLSAGTALTLQGNVSGAGGINQQGPGALVLDGAKTFTGDSTIAGNLHGVNASVPLPTQFDVLGTGTLTGTGVVGARFVLHPGAVLSPGNSPAEFRAHRVQFLSGASASQLVLELDGSQPDEFDRLTVDHLNLANVVLVPDLNFVPPVGTTFTIIDVTTSRTGTFLTMPDNSTFVMGGRLFRIDYDGGADGLDVVLTVLNRAPSVVNGNLGDIVDEDNAVGVLIPKSSLIALGSDPDLDPLSLLSFTQPGKGTLTDEGANLRYIPAANAFGQDSFTFQLTDGTDASNTATVTLSIRSVNDAPTLDAIPDVDAVEGQNVIALTGVTSGAANELQTVTVTVLSAVSDTPFNIAQPVANGTNEITFDAPAGFPVETHILVTVRVQDNGGTANNGVDTFLRQFTITIPRLADDGNNAGSATELQPPEEFFEDAVPGVPQTFTVESRIDVAADSDFFKFTAERSGVVEVRQRSTQINAFLSVYDADGRLLAYDDNSDGDTNSLLRFVAVQGEEYFLRANAVGTNVGTYDLVITFLVDEIGNTPFVTAFEAPLDVTALLQDGQGGATVFNGDGSRQTTTIDFPADVDFVIFVAPVSGRMTITETRAAPGAFDSELAVFHQTTTRTADPLEFLTANDDFDATLRSRVSFNVVAGQTYFVRVSGFGNSVGAWELDVVTDTNPADAEGDILADAVRASLAPNGNGGESATVPGNIDRDDDVDFLRFAPLVTGQATAVITTALPLIVDVISGGFRIAHDRTPADGLTVSFDVIAGQEYFLRIATAIPGTTPPAGLDGAYSVQFDTVPGEPTVQPGFVPTPEQVRFLYDQFVETMIRENTLRERPADEIAAAINQAIVNEFLLLAGDPSAFSTPVGVTWGDPVDFIQTDARGRQAGFTKAEGAVNEYGPRTAYTGDGAAELLIIPNATAAITRVDFVGVGAGPFMAGLNIITTTEVRSVTIAGTLFKGTTTLFLDFAGPPANPGFPGVPGLAPAPFDSASIAANRAEFGTNLFAAGMAASTISAVTSLTALGGLATGGSFQSLFNEFIKPEEITEAVETTDAGSTTIDVSRILDLSLPDGVKTVVNRVLNSGQAGATVRKVGQKILGIPELSLEMLQELLDDLLLIRRNKPNGQTMPETEDLPMPPDGQADSPEMPVDMPPTSNAAPPPQEMPPASSEGAAAAQPAAQAPPPE